MHRFFFYRFKKSCYPDSLDGPSLYKTPYRIYDIELENDDCTKEGETERFFWVEELAGELLPGKHFEVRFVDGDRPAEFSVELGDQVYFYVSIDHKPAAYWFRE